MSGLEVVGGIASVSQLCVYIAQSLAWVQATIKAVKDLPHPIQRKSQYLLSLKSIVDSIAHTPSLQTRDIEPHLQNIRQDVTTLTYLLSKATEILDGKLFPRVWKAYWTLSSTEKEISNALLNLELAKSNLHLYLTHKRFETSQTNTKPSTSTSKTETMDHKEIRANRLATLEPSKFPGEGKKLNKASKESALKEPANPAVEQNENSNRTDERDWSNIENDGEFGDVTFGDVKKKQKSTEKGPKDKRRWNEIKNKGKFSNVVHWDVEKD
ncbi:hypothetical protein MMC10_005817 [Thelotrema lepadinum]|nr:hypothetical protein [Thelotrema lepadinum]